MTGHYETFVTIGAWPNERQVVISDGVKSQTINICKPSNNREDGYERTYRINIDNKFTDEEISRHPDLNALYGHLTKRGATREK